MVRVNSMTFDKRFCLEFHSVAGGITFTKNLDTRERRNINMTQEKKHNSMTIMLLGYISMNEKGSK